MQGVPDICGRTLLCAGDASSLLRASCLPCENLAKRLFPHLEAVVVMTYKELLDSAERSLGRPGSMGRAH